MKIIEILPNDMRYSKSDFNYKKFEIDTIDYEIEDYVKEIEIKEVEEIKLLTYENTIKKQTENIIYNKNYYFENYLIQSYYMFDNEKKTNFKQNNIGINLHYEKQRVVNSCYFLKFRLVEENFILDNFTREDFYNFYREFYVKTMVKISTDNKIEEIPYILSVGEVLTKNKLMDYNFYEVRMCNSVLIFHINTKPNNMNINNYASYLLDKNIVDDVYISIRHDDDDNTNSEYEHNYSLSKEIIKKLLILIYHNKDNKIKLFTEISDEYIEETNERIKEEYNSSFYRYINIKYNSLKDKSLIYSDEGYKNKENFNKLLMEEIEKETKNDKHIIMK